MTLETATSQNQQSINSVGVFPAGWRSLMPQDNLSYVKANDIPVWLRQRARRLPDHDRRRSITDNATSSFKRAKVLLDHYGTIEQGSIFIIEPYARVDDDWSRAKAYAESIQCDLVVSEESYHCPPKTIRLAFVPRLFLEKLLDPKVVTPLSEYDPCRTSRKPEQR